MTAEPASISAGDSWQVRVRLQFENTLLTDECGSEVVEPLPGPSYNLPRSGRQVHLRLLAPMRSERGEPVRARLVRIACDWPLSEPGAHLSGGDDRLVKFALLWAMIGDGNAFLNRAVPEEELRNLRPGTSARVERSGTTCSLDGWRRSPVRRGRH